MFDKYWDDMFLVLATASVLDPRFKMKHLDLSFTVQRTKAQKLKPFWTIYAIYILATQLAISVRNQNMGMVQFYRNPDWYKYILEEDEEEEKRERAKEKEKKADAYEGFVFLQEYLKFEGSSTSRELQEAELDSYLKEPVLDWNKDLNALEWWKEESQKYPILSRIARDILSIPVSRGTSHRAYVADKRGCPDFIISLEAKLVNAMMCSESWPRR
uniref:Zinc finger BED domain-containing protein DAYSLEEPER n=1 Tax=Noccaea caerulescens TaxID=107243 RepID=A0A1J3I235_NOCCA